MSYKKLKDYETFDRSPFAETLAIEVRANTERKGIYLGKATDKIVNADGEIKGHAIFVKHKKVDQTPFVKIFQDKAADFFDLKEPARRVLGYIFNRTVKDVDYVFFDVIEAKKFTKYASTTSINKGIAELIEKGFIARRTTANVYYINPTLFFNGNRITVVDGYYTDDGKSIES